MSARREIAAAIILVMVVFALISFRSNCSTRVSAYDVVTVPEFNASVNSSYYIEKQISWSEVASSYESTALQIIPQTVLGFIQSSYTQMLRSWMVLAPP